MQSERNYRHLTTRLSGKAAVHCSINNEPLLVELFDEIFNLQKALVYVMDMEIGFTISDCKNKIITTTFNSFIVHSGNELNLNPDL